MSLWRNYNSITINCLFSSLASLSRNVKKQEIWYSGERCHNYLTSPPFHVRLLRYFWNSLNWMENYVLRGGSRNFQRRGGGGGGRCEIYEIESAKPLWRDDRDPLKSPGHFLNLKMLHGTIWGISEWVNWTFMCIYIFLFERSKWDVRPHAPWIRPWFLPMGIPVALAMPCSSRSYGSGRLVTTGPCISKYS